jgi:hypothetical protein
MKPIPNTNKEGQSVERLVLLCIMGLLSFGVQQKIPQCLVHCGIFVVIGWKRWFHNHFFFA